MKKVITAAIILVMIVGIVGGMFFNLKRGQGDAERLNEISARHVRLNAERNNLVAEKSKYVNLRDRETKSGNYLVLFFDNVSDNLVDIVYPMLNEKGHKGTIVLCEGLVPGEEGNISRRDFDFLLSKGWDTAIGYNSEIDMKAENAGEKLAEYLDDYIERLEAADIEIPLTYCFAKGEYSSVFEPILKKRGFKIIRHFGEGKDKFGSAYVEDEFYYIGSGLCCAASTNLQGDVDMAYENELAYSLSVRYVADRSIDTRIDCTTVKYRKMLDYLAISASGLQVCTIGELYRSKQEQLMSAEGTIGEYNEKIKQYDKRIAEIDKEIDDMLKEIG